MNTYTHLDIPTDVLTAANRVKDWAASMNMWDSHGWQLCGLTRYQELSDDERINSKKVELFDFLKARHQGGNLISFSSYASVVFEEFDRLQRQIESNNSKRS